MANSKRASRLVIGLTGPLGSGVSATAEALGKNGFQVVKLSGPIRDELRKSERLGPDSPINEKTVRDFRKKLQDIGNEGRRQSSSFWLDKIQIDTVSDVVIDGIRNYKEVCELRRRYHREFYLIALYASPERRWKRVESMYDGNHRLFERDDRRDSAEDLPDDVGQQVSTCVQQSDYVLVNENDAGSSTARCRWIFDELKDNLRLMRAADELASSSYCRPPSQDEVQMATAFAQSHMSRCLKRKVGAVIVSDKNIPLAMGYNENPIGFEPCLNKFKHCFKDENMHKKLEGWKKVICPSCGIENSDLRPPWKCASPDCGEDLKSIFFPSRNMELCTAIHAEERAIRSLGSGNAAHTLYATTYPCFQCARYIVDAGIKKVVYVEAYPVPESEDFLKCAGVLVQPFSGFKAIAFNSVFKQMV